jgi:hypothetical protein
VALLYGITRVGESLSVNVTPGSSTARLPTGLSHLPYYAACSLPSRSSTPRPLPECDEPRWC